MCNISELHRCNRKEPHGLGDSYQILQRTQNMDVHLEEKERRRKLRVVLKVLGE